MNEVLKAIRNNKIDYGGVPKDVFMQSDEMCDVSIILPVRGRSMFLKATLKSLLNMELGECSVSITVVEHSAGQCLDKISKTAGVNYIHIPCEVCEPFNKCLCMNVGAMFSTKSKYLLFHDSDLIVNKTFVMNAIYNLVGKSTEAVQTFFDRRVLFCSPELTKTIVYDELEEELSVETDGVYVKKRTGDAPGGSILVTRDLFFKVGGFDPELFHSYSPEDLFFWDKMNLYTVVGSCDDPANEVYHLDHPLQQNNNPDFGCMTRLYKRWSVLSVKDKMGICRYKRKLINKYK